MADMSNEPSPFGGERVVYPCEDCGRDVSVVVLMGDATPAWTAGDIEFRCHACAMRKMDVRVQSLLSAGDAVVELLAEDWDGADGLIGRAATLTAAWEQAKGA